MLEQEIANDIAQVLDWAINRSQSDGESLQADRYRVLKSYLSSRSETASELFTAADLARRGGQSKSPAKAAAARNNAMKGGAPGNYYACAYEAQSAERTKIDFLVFKSKENRDLWVQTGPMGRRAALPAVDTELRRAQRNNPGGLIDGDEIIRSLIEREEQRDQNEKYHNRD